MCHFLAALLNIEVPLPFTVTVYIARILEQSTIFLLSDWLTDYLNERNKFCG